MAAFVDDIGNMGGRDRYVERMICHQERMSNIKPVVRIEGPKHCFEGGTRKTPRPSSAGVARGESRSPAGTKLTLTTDAAAPLRVRADVVVMSVFTEVARDIDRAPRAADLRRRDCVISFPGTWSTKYGWIYIRQTQNDNLTSTVRAPWRDGRDPI